MFHEGDLADLFQTPKVFSNDPRNAIALPDSVLCLVPSEVRLGKASKFQKRFQIGPGR